MAEPKTETPCLEQLLDEVTPSVDGATDIADNVNMEEVLNALKQTSSGGLTAASRDRLKRQRRGNRMKVYDNGYIFTYDKDSSCGQRSFWRCERKNECPARVHTNPLTNQIIKRIHSHSHEPPSPDELPPWLLFKKGEDDNTSPPEDFTQVGSSSTACMLLPCPIMPSSSTIQNLQHLIDQTEEKVVMTDPEEDTTEPVRKRLRRSRNREQPADVVSVKELFLQHPTEFWELFEATRKMMQFLRGDERTSTPGCVTSTDCECDAIVGSFLDEIRMSKYKPVFAKFTMEVMRSLSQEDLMRLCRHDSDALLIYYSLRVKSSAASSASNGVKIYVRDMSGLTEESLYQMLLLKNQTKIEWSVHTIISFEDEFISALKKKGLVDMAIVERYYVPGPCGIKVELSDDIVSSWENESVVHVNVSKGVCRVDAVTLGRYNGIPLNDE